MLKIVWVGFPMPSHLNLLNQQSKFAAVYNVCAVNNVCKMPMSIGMNTVMSRKKTTTTNSKCTTS